MTGKKKRKDVLIGKTTAIKTGCGSLHVTINYQDGEPFEVMVKLGKAGGCASAQTETIGRLISIFLRYGGQLSVIATQLRGISCPVPTFIGGGKRVLSCPDAIAQVIDSIQPGDPSSDASQIPSKEPEATKTVNDRQGKLFHPCPECGSPLIFQEGCEKCMCGFTKC